MTFEPPLQLTRCKPAEDFLGKLYDRFLESASDDMKTCVAAGVELECSFEFKDGRTSLNVRTKYPCAVIRHPDGTVAVHVKKPLADVRRDFNLPDDWP